jgi:ATP-dependent protease HslVU (ClpYQ) peptidase subunit
MSQALKTSLFQEALSAIEVLSLEDQVALLDVLHNRLKLRQRQQVVREVREVQKEYREGKFKSGSVDDFLAELDS